MLRSKQTSERNHHDCAHATTLFVISSTEAHHSKMTNRAWEPRPISKVPMSHDKKIKSGSSESHRFALQCVVTRHSQLKIAAHSSNTQRQRLPLLEQSPPSPCQCLMWPAKYRTRRLVHDPSFASVMKRATSFTTWCTSARLSDMFVTRLHCPSECRRSILANLREHLRSPLLHLHRWSRH